MTERRGMSVRSKFVTAFVLMLLLVMTLAVLGEVLFNTKENYDLEIELSPQVEAPEDKTIFARIEDALGMRALADAQFEVEDENQTVWEKSTRVQIFKAQYTNDGEVTVESANNLDHVIAPGTKNTYTWTLKNSGTTKLDYTMSMKGWFEVGGEEKETSVIPIDVRVKKGDTYILGAAEKGVTPLELEKVKEAGTMEKKTAQSYTLEWEWPFERGDTQEEINLNDAEDTALGNEAVEHDIAVWIEINTTAQGDPEPTPTPTPTVSPSVSPSTSPTLAPTKGPGGGGGGGGGGSGGSGGAKTSDDFNLGLWIALGGAAILAMILIPLLRRRRENEKTK